MTKAELEKEVERLQAAAAVGEPADVRVERSKAEKAELEKNAAIEECNRLRGDLAKIEAKFDAFKKRVAKGSGQSETYRAY